MLRYDHPGHGLGSAPGRSRRSRSSARGVLEILDGRGLERVSFCGLSLGGAVGQWLAMHDPERIDRLVLACRSARFGVPENWRARVGTVRAERRRGGRRRRARSCGSRSETRRDSPELVRAYREMMVSAEREGYAGCCEALADWDPGDELGGDPLADARARRQRGSRDAARAGRGAPRRIPGARLSVLEGAGHLANLEQPEAFNRLLRRSSDGAARGGGGMSSPSDDAYERGMRIRREVLGDAHVDRAIERTTDFTADFQELITR